MCIRDSRYAGAYKTPLGACVDYLSFNAILAADPCAHAPDSCLLYTSDAADERSSVDLGGRRIIKKKKRHTLGDESNIHQVEETCSTR